MARLAWTTLGLLLLLTATVGSTFLPLGPGNIVANLGIAAAKAALIAAVFMQLSSAGKLIRVIVTIVVLWLALLFGLTLADRFTRPEPPGGPPAEASLRSRQASRASSLPQVCAAIEAARAADAHSVWERACSRS